jgi:fido (protein-threonine AMPylation protein)
MSITITPIIQDIIGFVRQNPGLSSSEIHDGLDLNVEILTTKRNLSKLVSSKLLSRSGVGKATKYHISPAYRLFIPIDVESYFEKEGDDRVVLEKLSYALIEGVLEGVQLLDDKELDYLAALQVRYFENISDLSESIYKLELARLAIDLSWKSSQIEGNTYTLLETEQLLKEQKEAKGKKKEEATMLLNHKMALDYIIDQSDNISPLSIFKIEEIHSLLIQRLGVDTGIRKRLVGITGTNFRPLDNEFQIREAMQGMCDLVNARENVYEKALLVLLLISYIQPFVDGNKRTARIVSNAILMSGGHCPLSYRSVDSIDYKKALLLFYEQNNIVAFKKIFIEQCAFAVNTYFQ